MRVIKSVAVDEFAGRGSLKDADVTRLARAFEADPAISRDEAERLFALHTACPVQAPSWADFFVRTIADYIVDQVEPEGYLTSEKAQWLVPKIATHGNVESKAGLDLLIAVLERARWSPASLVLLALSQVAQTVRTGTGPLRPGELPISGTIRLSEVDLVRRILSAFAAEGSIALTRPEVDMLFEINEAVDGSGLNPAWTDLFVKAVVNVAMAATGHAVPWRKEALAAEAGLADQCGLVPPAGLDAIVAGSLSQINDTYREPSSEERALLRLERQRIEIITGERIVEPTSRWLVDRLGKGKPATATQAALVAYLSREHAKLWQSLSERRGRSGKAA